MTQMKNLELTERELQVLRYMFIGRENLEIAKLVGISPLTVKNHVSKIIDKLGVHNRGSAVYKALELGFLTSPFTPVEKREVVEPLQANTIVYVWKKWRNIELCDDLFQIRIDGKAKRIGKADYQLLKIFLQNSNRVMSRDELMNKMWGSDIAYLDRSVDPHIHRVRKVLKEAGHPKVLKTKIGYGYVLEDKVVEPMTSIELAHSMGMGLHK